MKAEWIWKTNDVVQKDFAFFRKEFMVSKKVESATVYISAHNFFKFYINGKRVSGYGSPAPTDPQKGKSYLLYDVTATLHQGMNCFGAIVHFLGGDGQNYVNGYPGFLLQTEIIYTDHTRELVCTDESWQVVHEIPYAIGTPFQQQRRISVIEDFDARKYPKGWHQVGYTGECSSSVRSKIEDKKWQLQQQQIPEGVIDEVIHPVLLEQKRNVHVFDCGKIISGWPRLSAKGHAGQQIQIRYSEDLTDDGRVKHNVCNEPSKFYYDRYIFKGGMKEVWEPDFSYKSFRYLEIEGNVHELKDYSLEVISARTGLDEQGYFESSSQLLNDIYQACIQTQKNNIVGQVVDCPHREQAQYLADSDLQAETMIYHFSDATHMLRKVLKDFADGQLDNGTFPFVYPSNFRHPEFHLKIPEWDLHFCFLLWKIYMVEGNKKVLEQFYLPAKNMLTYYLEQKCSTLGLIPKSEEWHISDWPYPAIDQSGDYLTVQNIKIYQCSVIMRDISKILGYESDFYYFQHESNALKKSVIKHLYNKQRKCFDDSYHSTKSHQGTNVLSFQYGLVPEEDRVDLLNKIIDEGLGTRTLLSLNLLRVLFDNGQAKQAYKILQSKEYPGWGYMISKGYQTIWEGFEDIESHSHAWNAYPARMFLEYIVGIQNIEPGYRNVRIHPYIPDDLKFAEGRIPSPQGSIFCSWYKRNEGLNIKVNIPKNVQANVRIPIPNHEQVILKEAGKVLWKNGRPTSEIEGIQLIHDNGFFLEYNIGSGEFAFILIQDQH